MAVICVLSLFELQIFKKYEIFSKYMLFMFLIFESSFLKLINSVKNIDNSHFNKKKFAFSCF